jgi:mannose-1-phosphate guanylyltransferase
VVAALAKIKTSHDAGEPVVFMHADHHIRDTGGFIETLFAAAEIAARHNRIVLLGLEPTHPATGFGYIERGESARGDRIYDVSSFKEKPDRKTAEEYVGSGYATCGTWATLSHHLKYLKKKFKRMRRTCGKTTRSCCLPKRQRKRRALHAIRVRADRHGFN